MPARIRSVACGIVLTLLISGCGIAQQSTDSTTTTVANKDKETPVKTQEANSPGNKSLDPTEHKERVIVYETKVDLDNDGKPEKLVLDVERNRYDGYKKTFGEDLDRYSRLLIYKINDQTEELVFDSITAGITEFDGERISKEEFIRIADDDKSGTPEIYLKESNPPSDASRLAIIEKQNDVYHVLFFDRLDGNFKYKDFDNDGALELYGCTEYGGQIKFTPPLTTAFKRKDNKYIPSYSCTKLLINNNLQEAKAEFRNKSEGWLVDDIISLCLLGGYRDELKNFVIDNKDYLIKIKIFNDDKSLDDVDTFIKNFQPLDQRKRDWLESLKKYSL